MRRYGKGWRACFPHDVQKALVSHEVLMSLLSRSPKLHPTIKVEEIREHSRAIWDVLTPDHDD